jgi:FtsP/CotA-like multicopper oxidase with cupredoxin domain
MSDRKRPSRRQVLAGGAAFTVLGVAACKKQRGDSDSDSGIGRGLPTDDLYEPPLIPAIDGVLDLTMRLTMVDRLLTLPEGKDSDTMVDVVVHSYSYVVDDTTTEGPGPTLWLRKGERLKITLVNDLDPYEFPDPPIQEATDELAAAIEANGGTRGMNFPHQVNATNLHTHGIQFSPNAPADDTSIVVAAGESYAYDFGVVPDGTGGPGSGNEHEHTAGTYWYHPHKHGSTLHQFFFGVAGAILVSGEIDDYLHGYLRDASDDRVLIISSLALPADLSRFVADDERVVGPPINVNGLNPNDIMDYPVDENGDFVPDLPPDEALALRPTAHLMLNGQYQPTIRLEQGRLQRWRFVNAHAATTHNLVILGWDPDTETYDPAVGTDLRAVAVDGMTLAEVASFNADPERPDWGLSPGGRVDAMIRIDAAGTYRLATSTVSDEGVSYKLLAEVVVEASSEDPDPYPTELPAETREPRLDPDFQTSGVTHRVAFGMDKQGTHQFDIPPFTRWIFLQFDFDLWNGDNTPHIDKLFDPKRVDYAMALNGAEDWEVMVPNHLQEPHPFHLHLNPFYVVETQQLDDNNEPIGDPTPVNRWYDTFGIDPGTVARFKTRYLNHTGDSLAHCHIIGHGTWGMMQKFRIVAEGEDIPATPFWID